MTRFTTTFLAITVCLVPLFSTAWAAEDITSIQGAFLQGDYQSVLSQTHKLIPHASAGRRDQLLYLQGVSAFKLRDFALAKSSLEQLLKEFPHSPFSAQASAALAQVNQQANQPTPQPVSQVSQPEEPSFTIQIGAFSTKGNAIRVQKELQRKGYGAGVSESAGAENMLYRVHVGRFANRQEAEKTSDRLRSDGFPAQVKP